MPTIRESTTPTHTTRADLEAAGVQADQIARLEDLASRYPWIEFVDSVAQWQRLVFLKWLHAKQTAGAGGRQDGDDGDKEES